MKLIGFEDATFEKEGNRFEGYRFHFTEKVPQVTGFCCFSVRCRRRVAENFFALADTPEHLLGKDFYLVYDQFQKVDAILPIPTATGK